jgi:hypothetical protein
VYNLPTLLSCRITLVFGARPAISAAAALPALFSSTKLMVELITSNATIPTKSCQSGGLPYICSLKNKQIKSCQCEIRNSSSNYQLMWVCARLCVLERERERDVTPPFAKAMAMKAAASITQDRGFHIKPRNFRNLFSCFRIAFN